MLIDTTVSALYSLGATRFGMTRMSLLPTLNLTGPRRAASISIAQKSPGRPGNS